MPDKQEKFDLTQWVEQLPAREGVSGFESVLKKCAEAYGNTPADLLMVLRHYNTAFKAAMAKNVTRYQKVHDGSLPDAESLATMHDTVFQAILLRMWTYASEYYQRYTGPDLFAPVGEDDLAKLFGEGL